MASYAYAAINANGLEIAGELNAPDVAAAREQLRVRGLLASSLKELPSSGEGGGITVFKAVKPKSLQIFSRQFATMIEAGLNVVAALVILEQQTDDAYLGQVNRELRADVEGGLLISLPFIFKKWKSTESGRQLWDRFKLRVPMKIGDVVLKVTMARFSRTLSTLVAAGVDIIKALEITGQTAGNWVIEHALAGVRTKVHEGVPIAQPLLENEIFPPMVAQMVKIGEETGELEKMLGKIADFYEDEVDAAVSSLSSLVEPIMMIGVGIMVGIVTIAMYLPMFKMLTLVK